jgi:hypothetical protein
VKNAFCWTYSIVLTIVSDKPNLPGLLPNGWGGLSGRVGSLGLLFLVLIEFIVYELLG